MATTDWRFIDEQFLSRSLSHCLSCIAKTDLRHIDPNKNGEGKVFASRDPFMASSFLGRAGRGFVMTQYRWQQDGIPVFEEKCSGGFEYRYRQVPGAIYTLHSQNFQSGSWIEELFSQEIEVPITETMIIKDTREHLLLLERTGRIVIKRWSGLNDDQSILNHWLCVIQNSQKNRAFAVGEARAFIEYVHPHLQQEFEHRLSSMFR